VSSALLVVVDARASCGSRLDALETGLVVANAAVLAAEFETSTVKVVESK